MSALLLYDKKIIIAYVIYSYPVLVSIAVVSALWKSTSENGVLNDFSVLLVKFIRLLSWVLM